MQQIVCMKFNIIDSKIKIIKWISFWFLLTHNNLYFTKAQILLYMFLKNNQFTDGGGVVSLMHQLPVTPRKIPGTHFC
jgi:hypothetical protein